MAFIYALVVSGVYAIETSLFHVGLALGVRRARLRDAVLQGAVPADGARRRARLHGGIELPPRAGALGRRPHDVRSGSDLRRAARPGAALRRRLALPSRAIDGSSSAGVAHDARAATDRPSPKRSPRGSRRRRPRTLPADAVETARKLFLDVAGLCIAARREHYVAATLAAVDRGGGACTALGHAGGFDAFGAALVNGTAAHGEDYDDTFEGGPVHSGAVIVPAVLAACEREGLGGDRLLVGIVTGVGAAVPAQPGGADGDAQGRLSSDGGVRRARRGRRGRRRAAAAAGGDRVRARHRRQHGVGHHRVSRRRHVDQAHARRLGGAVGRARGADGARRVPRAAHGARRRARRLSRVRAVGRARLRAASRRPRQRAG